MVGEDSCLILRSRGHAATTDHSIIMPDAGFGISGAAYHAVECGHDALQRMKKSNFESLRKKAQLQSESKHRKSYRLTWVPTASNRKTQPALPLDASVDVYLHKVAVTATLTLYLVSKLPHGGLE